MQCYFGLQHAELRQLGFSRACPSRSRLAAISSIAMNDPTLGRLIDGGNESRDIDRLGTISNGTFTQCANVSKDTPVLERTPLSLARAFGG
jgi:hypothetical protein